MEALELARWQFGVTTVYHFIFVPLTIGLAPLVALMQTFWVRTGDEKWLRLTKFFGKLLLINFAMGVVTGIVQEFQFGMNWSEYSRFVGDIFGAPLAIEALLAFFLESTFLGLWIFGWDKLPKKIHLATIWLFALGVNLSAYFILSANSWMQHPVGAWFNPETGRAELVDFLAVLTNSTVLAAFPHTVSASFLVAGTFIMGIAAWWTVKSKRAGKLELAKIYRSGMKVGLWTIVVSGLAVVVSGDFSAKIMFEQQPMKMAAAEAMCVGEEGGAAFSILSVGNLNNVCDEENITHLLSLPGVTSWLATGDFSAELPGVQEVQADFDEMFGPGDYVPNLMVTYWSFRLMMGFGAVSAALAAAGLWLMRGGRVPDQPWFGKLGIIALPMPFVASAFGWIFTEMGRQPWVVAPNLQHEATHEQILQAVQAIGAQGGDPQVDLLLVRQLTADGVSTVVSPWMVLGSLLVFTLVYGALAVVWFVLMKRYTAEGLPEVGAKAAAADEPGSDQGSDKQLDFAY